MAEEQALREEETGDLLSEIRDAMGEPEEDGVEHMDDGTDDDTILAHLRGETAEEDASDEEPGAESLDETEEDTTPSGIAVDRLLRDVRERLGPQYEQAVKNLQADHTRWHQNKEALEEARRVTDETRQLQAQLRESLKELNEADDEDEEEADDELEGLMEGVTEDHEKLFRALLRKLGPEWAQENGYVKSTDLEQREQQRTAAQERQATLKSAVDKGIEQFGDTFGSRGEDGKFALNPEIHERMQQTYNRLGGQNFAGTILDLFHIACPDLVSQTQAQENGTKRRTDIEKRRRASTEMNSTPSSLPAGLYKKGDNIRKVVDKASRLAWKELPSS